MNDDLSDPTADSSSGFQPSPASFWDRFTWDPNTLGAAAFGEPTAPYRPPAQVAADVMDAVLTGPSHPGWAEPITRMGIDQIMAAMPNGQQPDGIFTGAMRQLAADGHPALQSWAANDAANISQGHPLGALWAMGQSAQLGAGLTQYDSQSVDANDPSPIDESAVTAPYQPELPTLPLKPSLDLNTQISTPNYTITPNTPALSVQPPTSNSPKRNLSTEGADFMKNYEQGPSGSFSPMPYNSPEGGPRTVGWGHKIKPGEIFNRPLTHEQADALFNKDVAAAQRVVENKTKGLSLTQSQYDALVSFAFNTPGAFVPKDDNLFLKRLQSGDLSGAAERMPLWNEAGPDGAKRTLPGLTARREDERNMFLNNVYPSTH